MTLARQDEFLRPLGTFERLFHLWITQHPLHFVIAVELSEVVEADRLRSALNAAQHRHPLLAARVGPGPSEGVGPSYYRDTAPVPLRVVAAGTPWRVLVAEELSRPFDQGEAPLLRAALVASGDHSVLLLVVEHSLADGIATAALARDLVALMDGQQLTALPLPSSQEDLLTTSLPPAGPKSAEPASSEPGPPSTGREPLLAVASRFTGVPPVLATAELSADETSRLVERCHQERTTVHGAICAAVSRVAASEQRLSFVRVMSPVSVRHLIDEHDAFAVRLVAAVTASLPEGTADLWSLARSSVASIQAVRTRAGAVTVCTIGESLVPPDGAAADAEGFLLGAMAFDVEVSNLGVLPAGTNGTLRTTAIWGPMFLNQIESEQVLGAATHDGRLRLTLTARREVPGFLEGVVALLRVV